MTATAGDVVIVDDPSTGADLARRLREDLSDPDVVTRATVPETRALVERRRVDCVVTDLDVPDGNGVEFLGGLRLLRSVREAYPDLPVILYTEVGNRDVAEEAAAADVTDYIPRWRERGSYERLVGRIESALQRRRADRRADRQARINEVIRDVNRALVRASSRDEIERSVCDRFAASDQYRLAWCGRTDDDGTVEARAWAGVDDPPERPLTVPEDDTASGPVYRALATHRLQVVQRAVEDPDLGRWREEAREWGYGSMAAVPFVYEETCYGVLAVYAARPDAFDDTERAVLAELGETIAHAVDAVRARAAIERRERDLQRQNERLEEFVEVVSHDLRNPMAVAKGHADLLAAEVDHESVDGVASALERMDRLVDDLLSLARQGRDLEDVRQVSLGAAAERAWDNVATGDATLAFDGEPRTVEADESRLVQALENLFRNAVEHGTDGPTPAGDAPVTADPSLADEGERPRDRAGDAASPLTVRVGRLDEREGFYVADDGVGIPEGERKRVLETGYTTSDVGTGFGLGIVRDVVEAHGWAIEIGESEAGGARFEFVTGDRTDDE